uniref:CCHC-type domain-containing protein n=1 Tax=Strigamia maritima TaxID=126957 RepID=T1J107_STRMM
MVKARSNTEGVPGTSVPLGKKTNAYLPKLPLATFKGELLQWPSFIDLFESSINKNSNLSLVEKIQYLKAACSGPAARVIEWFPIEEKNYQIALDALKEHFGSPEMIESVLVKVIKGLPPLKSIKPVLAVKEHLALMSGYARRLGWYDEKEVVLAKTVIPEILDKLLPLLTVQYQIESKKDPEKKKVKNMFTYLVDLIKSYEEVEGTEIAVPKEDPPGKRGYENKPREFKSGTMSTFVNTNNNRKGKVPLGCQFCGGNHTPQKCSTQVDPDKRFSLVNEKRLCYNCLGQGHLVSPCSNEYICPKCDKRHHLALCKTKDFGASLASGKNEKTLSKPSVETEKKSDEKKLNEITVRV